MPGFRVPGPLGFRALPIDTGTLCRGLSPDPGPLGSTSLAIDESLVADVRRTLFRAVVIEALRRGAGDHELALLRLQYLYSRAGVGQRGQDCALPEFPEELEDTWARLVIDEEGAVFDSLTHGEFERLNQLVGAHGPIRGVDDYRSRVRPLYYAAGYSDPASFLEKIVRYNLLGSREVLIHEDLASVLDRANPILDRWSPGLAARVSREISSAIGLQIRTIAGSTRLSNHAFGLAIDVDAHSNPHIVHPGVIEALNWAARKSGIGFDFGKSVLGVSDRGHKQFTADDVMEIHNRARPASDAVRDWLRTHLPRYRNLISKVARAEAALGLRPAKSTTKLEERSRAADKALGLITTKRASTSADKMSSPLSPDSPEQLAVQTIHGALGEIAGDEDLRRIQVLYENTPDTKYIETWEKRGVLTVPLYLAIVLVGELGLRWGEQYESSKDAMHFELVGQGDRPYLTADSPLGPGEKPRTLKRLMQEGLWPGRHPTTPNAIRGVGGGRR